MEQKKSNSALILAGAVAKGAFEAGAIETIVQAEIPISRIVATSSGALNGFLLAYGLRKNKPKLASQIISEIWREQASWSQILSISWKGVVTGQGFWYITSDYL